MNNNFDIAKKILQEKGEIAGITSGNSMKPLFCDGRDRAVIIPLRRPLRKNDVILYRKVSTNEVVLHRVVKTGDKPTLRGDNLFYNETNVAPEDILGVMKAFYRKGKYYECEKSLSYKFYTFCIRAIFPPRLALHKAKNLARRILKKRSSA